jgi:hypothetical protein
VKLKCLRKTKQVLSVGLMIFNCFQIQKYHNIKEQLKNVEYQCEQTVNTVKDVCKREWQSLKEQTLLDVKTLQVKGRLSVIKTMTE